MGPPDDLFPRLCTLINLSPVLNIKKGHTNISGCNLDKVFLRGVLLTFSNSKFLPWLIQ